VALALVIIIGGLVIVLTAAVQIPAAAAAFLRACIPLVEAFHDLRNAIRRPGSAQQDLGQASEAEEAEPSAHEQPAQSEHPEQGEVGESR